MTHKGQSRYRIVLTGETATMSDNGGAGVLGFTSALPERWIRGFVEDRLSRTRSDPSGWMALVPHGIARVEASLLSHGFSRDEVIIADSRKLTQADGA